MVTKVAGSGLDASGLPWWPEVDEVSDPYAVTHASPSEARRRPKTTGRLRRLILRHGLRGDIKEGRRRGRGSASRSSSAIDRYHLGLGLGFDIGGERVTEEDRGVSHTIPERIPSYGTV